VPNAVVQVSEVWDSRSVKDVDWNQVAAKLKPVVKFSIQSTKIATVIGFKMCQALVKVCATAFSSVEEQGRNDATSARPSETPVGTTMDLNISETQAVRTGGPARVDAAQSIRMATLSGLRAFAQICLTFVSSMERAAAADAAAFKEAESVGPSDSGEFEMQVETSQSTSRKGEDSSTVKRRTPYVDVEDESVEEEK